MLRVNIWRFLAFVAAILLVISISGYLFPAKPPLSQQEPNDAFDADLYWRTQTLSEWTEETKNVVGETTDQRETALHLLDLADRRAIHLRTGPGQHNLQSNWLSTMLAAYDN
ncbi:hypothetical protein [Tropicibacter sp. Alg240-R139]|uniref:hypothetical protein n=1 Tax=Tropicibacter sp. Alg240-R139 TaxID=2305991 RepID=UPI0013DFF3F5|nr:hypothetical protein [Tropicibacter sp. Alg240-R139]